MTLTSLIRRVWESRHLQSERARERERRERERERERGGRTTTACHGMANEAHLVIKQLTLVELLGAS